MLGSYAQFAQYMGFKSKSYVNTLKKQGRLVFVGNKIDFEKSKANIAETADISRQNVFDKTAAAEQPKTTPAAVPAPAKKQKTKDAAPAPQGDPGAKAIFDQARAEHQIYQARLKKIAYERAMGTLGSLDQIRNVGYEIGKIIKTRMATFAIRAAPVVTLESNEKANREYLIGEIEKVIAEIREEFEQTRGE